MNTIYLIEDYRDGYWSQHRGKFGGVAFATRYYEEEEAEKACEYDIPKDNYGPVFIKKGYERD